MKIELPGISRFLPVHASGGTAPAFTEQQIQDARMMRLREMRDQKNQVETLYDNYAEPEEPQQIPPREERRSFLGEIAVMATAAMKGATR